jgi:F0F1-type ATP synthase alpha subunit
LVDRGEKLTRLLVQNRYEPIDIVDQTIFLYSALNGYLDGIPVNLVSFYEKELYSFIKKTIFYEPLHYQMRHSINPILLDYLLGLFKQLDDATKRLVDRGEKLTRLLVQNRYEPIDIVDQTIFLYSALNGYLDGIPVNLVSFYEKELYSFIKKTIFYEPLHYQMRYSINPILLDYLLGLFKQYFIENIH